MRPPLAMGLIRNKLKEHGLAMEEHVIEAGDIFNVGAFKVEAIHTNHSIADAMAYSIKCPGGHLVHTGDLRLTTHHRLARELILLNLRNWDKKASTFFSVTVQMC